MGRQEIQLLAVLLTGLLVVWLLFKERNWRGGVSTAVWIPVIWMVILGSRPVSMWFGSGIAVDTARADLEGSPFDASIFLLLIVAAVFVLWRRRIDWHDIMAENKWLFIYFLYLGISVLWSDYPDVAFKRWVKDAGSILMVLVILTEDEPLQAIKAAFFRCTCLLIPTSVLLVKCFPYIGSSYDPWDGQPYYSGVGTNKNMLGMALFVCGLSLAWAVFDFRDEETGDTDKTRVLAHLLLGLMTVYLLAKAHSATAIGCSVLGVCIILGMRLAIRWRVKRLGTYGFALALLLTLLYVTFDVDEALIRVLGRDTTLTGRTDIWRDVLNENINPLIGAGHASFWLSADRVERLSQGLYFKLNEAHNGYLEVYINSGLIGSFLLILVLISGARKTKRAAVAGSTFAALRLGLLLGTVVYGMTEAVFRFGFIFFALLLVLMERPLEAEPVDETEDADRYSAVAT
jgi:exopolysaccharide production protein ExoQ